MKNLKEMSLVELDKNELSEINGGGIFGALVLLGALLAGAIVGVLIALEIKS